MTRLSQDYSTTELGRQKTINSTSLEPRHTRKVGIDRRDELGPGVDLVYWFMNLKANSKYMSADLTKGSFRHSSSYYVIQISKTSKISIFRMFLQKSQIAPNM